jgi:hypothetical protein
MIIDHITPKLFYYCGVDQIVNIMLICRYLISTKCESLTSSQLLEGLKCESQIENNERGKNQAPSLARNIIEG